MHQKIDAIFGNFCIALKICVRKSQSKRAKKEVIWSKIVHCLVHVNTAEKMLNTAMTTRGGAVFVVR